MGLFSKKTKEPAKAEPKECAAKETEDKSSPSGSYIVSTHPDGGWQVKRANAQKALKRFDTKAEAEAYAKQVANNQGESVIRKKKNGAFQKKH